MPSGLSPIKPQYRINHDFPHEGEVLQSIQQVANSINSQVNIYIKHPSAFNPKYIRVRKQNKLKKYSPSTTKEGPRGPARTPALPTTRRRSGSTATTRPCSHGRAKGSTLLPTREAERLGTVELYRTPQTGSGCYLQKATSRQQAEISKSQQDLPVLMAYSADF